MEKIIGWVKAHPKTLAFCAIAAVAVVLISFWYRGEGVVIVSFKALDSFEVTLDTAIKRNADDLVSWYRANIVIQSILIITGLFATVSAAATTKENAADLKAYTVVLTAITSTLAIVLTTFHIRENIETFIRANSDLVGIETDYLRMRGPTFEAALRQRAEEAAASGRPRSDVDRLDPPGLIVIQAKFQKRYLDVESARLHAWASVGQQSLPTSSPQPPPATDVADALQQTAPAGSPFKEPPAEKPKDTASP